MAVTYSAKGTIGYGTRAVNATVPTGYKAGDLLVLFICGRNALPALPANWTNINTINNSNRIYFRACYKISAASEATLSVADSGSYTVALMTLFKGNDTINPINVSGTNIDSGTTFVANGVTTTQNRCMIVYSAGFQDAGTSNDTSNYTSQANASLTNVTERNDNYYRSGTNSNGGIYVVTANQANAGATGNMSATADSANNFSAIVTFAIQEPSDTGTGFLEFFM